MSLEKTWVTLNITSKRTQSIKSIYCVISMMSYSGKGKTIETVNKTKANKQKPMASGCLGFVGGRKRQHTQHS